MKRINTMNLKVKSAITLVVLSMVGAVVPASTVYAEENNEVVETPQNEGNQEDDWWQNVMYYPIDWIRIPYYIPEIETPSNVENDNTPVNELQTPSNTPNVETPSVVMTEAPTSVQEATPVSVTVEENASALEETQNEQTSESSSKSTRDEKMNDLIREIRKANAEAQKTGEKKTLYHNDLTTLSLDVMKTLRDCPNVVLDMTCKYDGAAYHMVITGGNATVFDESVSWYGPLWLNGNYGV